MKKIKKQQKTSQTHKSFNQLVSGRDARQIPIVWGGERVNEDQRLDASRSTYHRSSQHRYLRLFFLNSKVEDQTNKILTCTRYRGSTFK